VLSLGTAYETAKTVTAITNANPAVASSASHGYANGDIVVVDSGWPALNQAVARVSATAAGTFALEGYDTTNTSRFPAGAGGGAARKVTAWVPMSQSTDTTSSGGEQQFYQWMYLEDGQQRQRPTFKNARSLTWTMDFDDTLPWYNALLTADRDGSPHVIRIALPTGATIYYNVYVGFDGEPTFVANQNMQVTATFSLASPRSQRYR
jgi:hypothetical protein